MVDVWEGQKSVNGEFERVGKEMVRLLEDVNVHKMEEKKLERMLLEKEVVMKAMTRFIAGLKRNDTVYSGSEKECDSSGDGEESADEDT